ncbi:MAG: enoyl-CoA hydratase-related protein [Gemmatimonadota bacterium]|nr:enoyl-CoA hydratase-related protein [Gemmatimonadota bacterium]
MADDTILISTEGRVATITINRPDKLNALNEPTRAAIVTALHKFEHDPEVRVVILTGAGEKAFIAGADIGEFDGRTPVDQFRVMNSPEANAFEAADRFPKPIIAAINGFCLGGGCELAMACDIRIASDRAKLGQPEINLGLLPGGGGTQRLPRLVGLGDAYRLLYTGDMVTADEALRLGLVSEVVPAADLMPRVKALAAAIASKSPVALRYIKEAVRASVRAPMDEGLRLERTLFGLVFSSADMKEGVKAFLEKRKPDFQGR